MIRPVFLWTAAHAYFARVGLVHPVQDAHERGLAGAVLAGESVNLAGLDDEIDAVIGDSARESLGDAAKLDGGC